MLMRHSAATIVVQHALLRVHTVSHFSLDIIIMMLCELRHRRKMLLAWYELCALGSNGTRARSLSLSLSLSIFFSTYYIYIPDTHTTSNALNSISGQPQCKIQHAPKQSHIYIHIHVVTIDDWVSCALSLTLAQRQPYRAENNNSHCVNDNSASIIAFNSIYLVAVLMTRHTHNFNIKMCTEQQHGDLQSPHSNRNSFMQSLFFLSNPYDDDKRSSNLIVTKHHRMWIAISKKKNCVC